MMSSVKVDIPGLGEILPQRHGENFTVASRFLPRAPRRDLLAIYGFARLVDDIGDDYRGDRLAALDWLETDLDAALAGATSHPANRDIAATLAKHGMNDEPLRRLIQANRQDQRVKQYQTFAELEEYCRLSANPVGRLVLGIFEAPGARLERLSDLICTGLQVAEHLQDVAEDARRGRVYLPRDDLQRFGFDSRQLLDWAADDEAGTTDSTAGSSAEMWERLRPAIAFETAKARRLIERGSVLVDSLGGWALLAVTGFVAGGLAALDSLSEADFDISAGPPEISRLNVAGRATRLLARRARLISPAGQLPVGTAA
jgi:squalene synthase HpnC